MAVGVSQGARGDTWQARRRAEAHNRRRRQSRQDRLDRPAPPAPPPHPPRERPPRGPLPPLPPPLPPRLPPPPLRRPYPRPPSPSPSPLPPSLSPSLPVFGKGLAGAFDSVEQPFGRGFRLVLPEARDGAEARDPGPPPASEAATAAQVASSSPWWAPATPPAMPPAPDKPSFEARDAARPQPPPSPRRVPQGLQQPQPPPPPTLPLPRRPMPPPLLELPTQLPPSPPLGKGGVQKHTRRVYPRTVLHDDGRWDAEEEGAQQGGGEGEGATDSLRYRKWCGAWAQLHECEDNPRFMRSHCGRSCRTTARLIECSMRELLGDEGHQLGLSAEAIRAIHTLDAEWLRDGQEAAAPATPPVVPQAVRVTADGGFVNMEGGIHIDELHSGQTLHIQGGKKTFKAVQKKDTERERKERARAKKEKKGKVEEKGGKGDKGDKEGPLTADEQAYARELTEELRPLFRRMPPTRQVSLLNKLAADWRLLSPTPGSE